MTYEEAKRRQEAESSNLNPVPAFTANCGMQHHGECEGYVAPLIYGADRPCSCACHDTGNPRDYRKAEARARQSFYYPTLAQSTDGAQ